MGSKILETQCLSLRRGRQTVLTDISISIKRGEVLVVIGPSGAGKSSLLRCFNRLENMERGRILFNESDITTLPILDLRRQIGMVFQKSAVFEGTVADNICFGPRLRDETLTHERILELMAQAALEPDLIDRDAHELSGGQEQRLAIARALANQPSVLLLDEPTSALDPIATHKVEDILLHLRDTSGLTLVWVSHSVEQARRVADRVLLLEDGRVSRFGTVDALLDHERGDAHTLAFARGVDDNDAVGVSP